ncbi:MAG: IclR family transcriptional regulator [Deltaproteobacteria bacterium]|nr:IclR family transcriptional regulator [Deltaproteobacteria bacterium]MBW2068505.1 IclR family transcriptional regulator [Deltaproteobacteria bacterium]
MWNICDWKVQLSLLDKALIVLKSFSEENPEWGVRKLAADLGMSPPTVQRILKTLKKHGFLEQNEQSKRYRLGTIYFRFVEILQSRYPLVQVALPFMRRLCSKTGETTHLNVIDGFERLCVSSIESAQSLKAGMPIGNRSPLYAGASSKCLLAFSDAEFISEYLDRTSLVPLTENTNTDRDKLMQEIDIIRKQGFALSHGERTPGLGSLSVPIFGHGGSLLGALSLAIPELRFLDDEHRRFCLSSLTKTGEAISRAMGYGGEYPPSVIRYDCGFSLNKDGEV